MSTESDRVVRRLVGGDPAAEAEVLAAADTTDSVAVLVGAALLAGERRHLERAAALAGSSRERQLVALAEAHLARRTDLLDVLVRDHLADHPDHLLACWIAGRPY